MVEKKGKTQEKMERGSRKRTSSAGSENTERVGGNGRILLDRPKPPVGCSANGRRRRRRRRRRSMCNSEIFFLLSPELHIKFPSNTSTLKHGCHCVQAYELHNLLTYLLHGAEYFLRS